jgi:LysM repeat protein
MKNIILNKIAEIKQKFADVDTENELEIKENTLSLKGAVYVVAGLHVAVLVGIMFFSSATKARAIAAEDKKFLENAPIVGVEEPKIATGNKTESEPVAVATPSPTPEKPVAVAKPTPIPASMIQTKVVDKNAQNPNYPTKLKEYVVKKGDNFHKIAKKYKLNEKKLQALNNIKDTSKLSVGQKLKLM